MKSRIQLSLFILLMATCMSVNAQTLTVDYDYSMNLSNQMDDKQKSALVTKAIEGFSSSFIFKLTHCKGKSSVKRVEVTSNQSNKMTFQGRSHEMFKDFSTQHFYIANTKLENTVVKNTMKQFYNWEIANETITVKGYVCKKATTQEGDKTITAWFTESIAITDGPSRYFGLPGLILKLQTATALFEAKTITFDKADTDITMPTATNNVTYAEFSKQQFTSTNAKH